MTNQPQLLLNPQVRLLTLECKLRRIRRQLYSLSDQDLRGQVTSSQQCLYMTPPEVHVLGRPVGPMSNQLLSHLQLRLVVDVVHDRNLHTVDARVHQRGRPLAAMVKDHHRVAVIGATVLVLSQPAQAPLQSGIQPDATQRPRYQVYLWRNFLLRQWVNLYILLTSIFRGRILQDLVGLTESPDHRRQFIAAPPHAHARRCIHVRRGPPLLGRALILPGARVALGPPNGLSHQVTHAHAPHASILYHMTGRVAATLVVLLERKILVEVDHQHRGVGTLDGGIARETHTLLHVDEDILSTHAL